MMERFCEVWRCLWMRTSSPSMVSRSRQRLRKLGLEAGEAAQQLDMAL